MLAELANDIGIGFVELLLLGENGLLYFFENLGRVCLQVHTRCFAAEGNHFIQGGDTDAKELIEVIRKYTQETEAIVQVIFGVISFLEDTRIESEPAKVADDNGFGTFLHSVEVPQKYCTRYKGAMTSQKINIRPLP